MLTYLFSNVFVYFCNRTKDACYSAYFWQILGHVTFYLLPRFYPGFTQLPRVKLGKTVQRSYPPTLLHCFTAFLSCLQELSWDDVTQIPKVQSAFNRFYEKALFLLNYFYPLHQITLSNRDPSFVTPCIKGLLRKRNKLMRKGAVLAAESLSKRIGTKISEHNRCTFSHSQRGTKELWDQVRKVTGREDGRQDALKQVTVEQLNHHFATISTDPEYKLPQPKLTAATPQQLFTEYRVFRMLDTLKPTAMGLDGLPDWFLQLAAPAFASPFTYLFNLSADTAIIPTQWKSSRIRPVPKVAQPQGCHDYRPISITPIL